MKPTPEQTKLIGLLIVMIAGYLSHEQIMITVGF